MKQAFRAQAKIDMRWFAAYYSKRFPQGRKNAERSFRTTIELVLANPFVGTPFDNMPARRLAVQRTPFVLIYAIVGDSIDVLRVWDTRADPIRLDEN